MATASRGPELVGVLAAKVRAPGVTGLPRPRLDERLAEVWSRRLTIVVGPAGSGKTTLLSSFAGSCGAPFGWYRAESWDGGEERLLRYLQAALQGALGEQPRWDSIEAAVAGLEEFPGPRLLLVIDDLHTMAGSPAERCLERLLDYAPPCLAVAAGSRSAPAWNLSRRRVSGQLLEVGGDDLRFRSWEVERLFTDFYREPVPPVELAELARRTEGWAAGLQLFHLATSGRPAGERRRVLSSMGPRSSLAGEYLTENVLEGLPRSLREFLLSTCVLGRLSGRICDAYRGSADSQHLLEELERRQLFTHRMDDDGTYRYHEVLRAHLEGVLVQELGSQAIRHAFRRAGQVLAAEGATLEALRAFCRAEDWESVDALLGMDGDRLARQPGYWIEALPLALVDEDPWLLLARARGQRGAGMWLRALDSYRRAEAAFGAAEASRACRDERRALAAWLETAPRPPRDELTLLRAAVSRNPLEARRPLEGLEPAGQELVSGLAGLVAGELLEARAQLDKCCNRRDASPVQAACAYLGTVVCDLLSGTVPPGDLLERQVDRLEEMGQLMLARLGRAAGALTGRPESRQAAATARAAAEEAGDAWGAAVSWLLESWAAVLSGDAPAGHLEQAAQALHRLGAGSLEAWSRSLLALAMARQGAAEAREAALQAEAFARSCGVPNAQIFAYLALAELDSERGPDFRLLAESLQRESGLALPAPAGAREPDAGAAGVEVHCFGGFSIRLAGGEVDLGQLKPKSRALLRLLAVNGGNPVHREVIQEALWPDADSESAARSLHVAISAVRRALEPEVPRGAPSLLRREGEAYRLALGSDDAADIVHFDTAAAAARSARQRGDMSSLAAAFARLSQLHSGDLLPEDGSAEWVIGPRERCRGALTDAAQGLAGLLLESGRAKESAEVCATGLRVDRYQDALWQLLVAAREAAGEVGAANRARAEYEQVLSELGVLSPAPLRSLPLAGRGG